MSIYIGVDLGGTNIKAGLVNVETGKVLLSKSAPTLARDGHDAVMLRMADVINGLIKDCDFSHSEIKGIGVSAPGALNIEEGLVLFLPNLPGQWRDVPLRATLEGYLGIPISMLNDVRAITLGEYSYGAGKGVRDMACFAIGTGIGGGLVIHGKLVLGIRGTGGELGHQTIDINGPRCGCGNYGCLEVFASGPAIASMAEKAVRQGLTTMIADIIDYDLNKISPRVVAEAAEAGDEIAREIWDRAGHYLGTAIANVMVAFGPRRVVLSGGVAAAGELLLAPVRRTIEERVFIMPRDEVEIVLNKLGDDAGILGMAKWAALGPV